MCRCLMELERENIEPEDRKQQWGANTFRGGDPDNPHGF